VDSRSSPRVLLETCATGSHVTGLERVAKTISTHLEGFVPFSVATSHSSMELLRVQYLDTPCWLNNHPRGVVVPITFPPSLIATTFYADRIIPYIHDLFLIDGTTELNRNARLYMAPAFRHALRRCSTFLTNSETTRDKLRGHCRPGARLELLRPMVDDVFNIAHLEAKPWKAGEPLHLLSIGTVEPRKGLLRAARLRADLEMALGQSVTLNVVGRRGWGADWDELVSDPHVKLHGYLPPSDVRRLISDAHIFISASHDEGLGLPLLEVQHGSKLVVASDIPAYREVLGESGLILNFENRKLAVTKLAEFLNIMDLVSCGRSGQENVKRWNELARTDLSIVAEMLKIRTVDACE